MSTDALVAELYADLPPVPGCETDGWQVLRGIEAIERTWVRMFETGCRGIDVELLVSDCYDGSGPIERSAPAVILRSDGDYTLTPDVARRVAFVLMQAADEVEQMGRVR
ncbi:hypothetical protein [Nocardia sp. BMG51109]|uniref:hypothetical protein n=1 Tax=Nocardia sp. BMG51109 TaxID=1056816 RepID=UPI000466ED09|nr:hypothetical protein [Nocardia sp. BMG51109]